MNFNLLSSTSRVEAPIIYVTIGNYTFGLYNKVAKSVTNVASGTVTYPNFMKSLTVEKVNGVLNAYSIQMIYAIRNGDDPNLLEKVFSSVSDTRKIVISYGDATNPAFLYKEEEAIITDITSNINIASSTITYTLKCTSEALSLSAGTQPYGKVHDKPSEIIKSLLRDTQTGLQDIFYGMRDYDLVISKGLIAGDDVAVDIEAKSSISVLEYLKYLVSCMTPSNDDKKVSKARYVLTVSDDISQEFGGPYFKITKVESGIVTTNDNVYDLDIGVNSKDLVSQFSIEDDQTYSILYNYSEKLQLPNYIYRLDNNGNVSYEYSPALTNSSQLMKTTSANRVWWSTVTQYPISCTVTIKGLLRAAMLMSYVNLNVYFYGKKHISSGLYMLTRQIDSVDESGCKTQLTLTRVGGASDN